MKEIVILSCEKSLSDVEKFLKRSGNYVDAGYRLESFKTRKGLEAVFVTKPQKGPNPIGFQYTEEEHD